MLSFLTSIGSSVLQIKSPSQLKNALALQPDNDICCNPSPRSAQVCKVNTDDWLALPTTGQSTKKKDVLAM